MSATMTTSAPKESGHLAAFERFAQDNGKKNPVWLQSVRRTSISHFTELGFPTTHDEEWRFTPVAEIEKFPFKPALQPTRHALTGRDIEPFTFGGLQCHLMVFVN